MTYLSHFRHVPVTAIGYTIPIPHSPLLIADKPEFFWGQNLWDSFLIRRKLWSYYESSI